MPKAKEVEKDKLDLVVKALASVSEAYEMAPRSTFRVGELERIAKKLLEDLKEQDA